MSSFKNEHITSVIRVYFEMVRNLFASIGIGVFGFLLYLKAAQIHHDAWQSRALSLFSQISLLVFIASTFLAIYLFQSSVERPMKAIKEFDNRPLIKYGILILAYISMGAFIVVAVSAVYVSFSMGAVTAGHELLPNLK